MIKNLINEFKNNYSFLTEHDKTLIVALIALALGSDLIIGIFFMVEIIFDDNLSDFDLKFFFFTSFFAFIGTIYSLFVNPIHLMDERKAEYRREKDREDISK